MSSFDINNAEKIAIIIPVYNVEQYLYECVISVCNQSYQNIQIILVDDGSTDSSGQLCDELAAKDSRIHVIHTPNQGAAAARNTGLDYVSTKNDISYIGFVDSDDIIHPLMYEYLLKALKQAQADIAVCDTIAAQGADTFVEKPVYEIELPPEGKTAMAMYWKRTALWDRLYRAWVWQDLRLPEGIICEDRAIMVPLHHNKKEVRVCAQLYYYRMRENSIVNQKFSLKKLDWFVAQEMCIHDLEAVDFAEKESLLEQEVKKYCHYAEIYGNRLRQELGLHKEARELREKMQNMMRRYRCRFRFPLNEFLECYRLLYPKMIKLYDLYKADIRKLTFRKQKSDK